MCRSIRTLREPYAENVTGEDIDAAALQYVRKVSGFRAPSRVNTRAFDEAVASVARATQELLAALDLPSGVRGPTVAMGPAPVESS